MNNNKINSCKVKVKVKYNIRAWHPDNPAAKGQPPERLIHTVPIESIPTMIRDLVARGWGINLHLHIYIKHLQLSIIIHIF